jgi:phosphatidylglycerol:prolipoprotein diacylglycerol transferase
MPNSELRALAAGERSVPVHPTQLYASAAALALSVYLAWLFRRRSRDGVVVVSLFILYPIVRFVLEIIRADNPHDTFGLTISQFISVAMFTTGIAALAILYKTVPPLGADSATAPTTAPATSNGDRPRKARTRAKRRR